MSRSGRVSNDVPSGGVARGRRRAPDLPAAPRRSPSADLARDDRGGRSAERPTDDRRGQTLIDYTIGISLFLIAVMFVFATVPTIFAPFQSPIESDQSAQSNRLASQVASDLTAGDSETYLNASGVTDFFSSAANPTDASDLRSRYGLDREVHINVTLRTVEPLPDRTVGDRVGGHAVAASTRVLSDGGNLCRPTCRLVVRMW